MFSKLTLCAAGAAVLATLGTAQNTHSRITPVTAPVKDAGTYHLATNTWTRGAPRAALWNDVVYDNTCTEGWHMNYDNLHRAVDNGRIPSTTSPENPGPAIFSISWTGTQDQYPINYFELSYCSYDIMMDVEVNFWEAFANCADSTLTTPIATFILPNMPASNASGSQACWTVGIDLANSGQSFVMLADGDGVYDSSPDTFGYSWYVSTPVLGGNPGPLVAGDPLGWRGAGPAGTGCDLGANTAFYNGFDINNTQGTGLDNANSWEIDTLTGGVWGTPGCYWFGDYLAGNPWGSFYLQIGAETGIGSDPGIQYCPGNGVAPATPCPCANNNNGMMGGCDWANPAFPEGGVLNATGDPDVATADITLIATGIENNFGIFFGADNAVNSGNGNPLNDGLRCAGGGLIRLTPPTMATGNMASHGPVETSDASAVAGATRRYQYWFRTPNGPCGQMANLTNGYEIAWL